MRKYAFQAASKAAHFGLFSRRPSPPEFFAPPRKAGARSQRRSPFVAFFLSVLLSGISVGGQYALIAIG